jgi:hypothetical protein
MMNSVAAALSNPTTADTEYLSILTPSETYILSFVVLVTLFIGLLYVLKRRYYYLFPGKAEPELWLQSPRRYVLVLIQAKHGVALTTLVDAVSEHSTIDSRRHTASTNCLVRVGVHDTERNCYRVLTMQDDIQQQRFIPISIVAARINRAQLYSICRLPCVDIVRAVKYSKITKRGAEETKSLSA